MFNPTIAIPLLALAVIGISAVMLNNNRKAQERNLRRPARVEAFFSIDAQNDFGSPEHTGGKGLPVPDGEQIAGPINQLLKCGRFVKKTPVYGGTMTIK